MNLVILYNSLFFFRFELILGPRSHFCIRYKKELLLYAIIFSFLLFFVIGYLAPLYCSRYNVKHG